MKTLLPRLAAILVLATSICLNSACSTSDGQATTSRAMATSTKIAEPAPVRPQLSRNLRRGKSVTVIQKDGSIIGFTIDRVEKGTVHGITPAGSSIAIPIKSLKTVARADLAGQPAKKGATYHLLGAFAKTGEYGGKVALTGLAILGTLLGGCGDPVGFVDSIW